MNPKPTECRESRVLHLSNVREALACAKREYERAAADIRDANERAKNALADAHALERLLVLAEQFVTGAQLDPDSRALPM